MSVKKVLVIPSWYPSDKDPFSGSFIKDQVEAQSAQGQIISVFNSRLQFNTPFKNILTKPFIEKEPSTHIPTFVINGFSLPKSSMYLLNLWAKKHYKIFEAYMKDEGKPDLLHAHSFIAGYLSMKLSTKYNIPYIITEHYSGFLLKSIGPLAHKTIQKSYAKASRLIAVSQSLKNQMQSFTSNEIEVLGNMYKDIFFYQSNTVKKNSIFTFITIGGLDSVKNYEMLIHSFSIFQKNNKNVNLIIIGDGVQRTTLEEQICSLNLESHIKLLGSIPNEDIPNIMRKCHVYVCSSKVETFGITLVEALACGLPVVCTDCKGPLDYLDIKNSIVSISHHINDFSASMQKMFESYHSFDNHKISNAIYEKYNAKLIGKKLIDIYKSI